MNAHVRFGEEPQAGQRAIVGEAVKCLIEDIHLVPSQRVCHKDIKRIESVKIHKHGLGYIVQIRDDMSTAA